MPTALVVVKAVRKIDPSSDKPKNYFTAAIGFVVGNKNELIPVLKLGAIIFEHRYRQLAHLSAMDTNTPINALSAIRKKVTSRIRRVIWRNLIRFITASV
jgi:hypothetical protein